jgi:hypothetical protein
MVAPLPEFCRAGEALGEAVPLKFIAEMGEKEPN